MTSGLNAVNLVSALNMPTQRASFFVDDPRRRNIGYAIPCPINFVAYEPIGSPTALGAVGIRFNFSASSAVQQLPGGIAGVIIDTTSILGIPSPIVGPPYLDPNLQTFVYFPDTGQSIYCPWLYQVHAPVITGALDFVVYVNPGSFRLQDYPPISVTPVNVSLAPYMSKRYPQPGLNFSNTTPTTTVDIR